MHECGKTEIVAEEEKTQKTKRPCLHWLLRNRGKIHNPRHLSKPQGEEHSEKRQRCARTLRKDRGELTWKIRFPFPTLWSPQISEVKLQETKHGQKEKKNRKAKGQTNC